MTGDDPHHLRRFIDAQAPLYERVTAELGAGRKRTHWMWFIFPQIAGLGHSPMAQTYAIASPAEACAYCDHPVLGARLRACTALVLAVQTASAHDIFGSPDDLKFHSSMTLFARVRPEEPAFARALGRFFAGVPDSATLARL
jgi:uncharacterized protein (DUF1810 family)